MLAGDLDVAGPAQYADIAATRGDHHRHVAGHTNIHIGGDGVVPGALRIRVQGDRVVSDIDLRFGTGIDPVGLILVVCVYALVRRHADLLVVRDGQVYGAVLIYDAQAGAGGEILLHLVVVREGVAEKLKVIIAQIDVVAERIQIQAGCRCGRHAEDNQKYQQQNATGSDSCRAHAFLLSLLVFEQLDHAPKNDESWPIGSEPAEKRFGMQDAHCGEQQHYSQQNQDDRPRHRAARPSWWRLLLPHRGRSLYRASHSSPPALLPDKATAPRHSPRRVPLRIAVFPLAADRRWVLGPRYSRRSLPGRSRSATRAECGQSGSPPCFQAGTEIPA